MVKHVLVEANGDDNYELFCVWVNKRKSVAFFLRPCFKFLMFSDPNIFQLRFGYEQNFSLDLLNGGVH